MTPPEQQPVRALALAGLAASWVAMSVGYWLPGLGLPRMDVAMWNGNLLVPDTTSVGLAWTVGAIQGLGFGALLGIVYGRVARPRLPGPAALRGIIWGSALAVVFGMVLMPLLYGAGIFGVRWSSAMPVTVAVWHLAYGATLGVCERL